jgi:signal transduction histidine kinase
MMSPADHVGGEQRDSIACRAAALFAAAEHNIHQHTDRLFAALMVLQWIAGIVFALWVSPLAWAGAVSRTHVHVWAAILVGGSISLFPAALALLRPGQPSTRYTIAVAQMLMGALLIHLTGGRLETHFHVFGSLAFLAFYRDWRVFVPATIVVALDHMLRGAFWPQSVYGVVVPSQWRWVEHAAWVIFENVFLLLSIHRSVTDMKETAERTATLEHAEAALAERMKVERHNAQQLSVLVAQLRETQRQAEAATRAKSDFLASMSHELRTPLNAIILYSELLQDEARDGGQERAVVDLQRILSAGKHLLELINGILDLSKIEAGKMALALEAFDVKAMLDELVDTVGPVVQQNNNSLTVTCRDDVGEMVADLMKTRQILLNLLSNAGKFTRDGAIAVEARRGAIGAQPAAVFTVTDSGVGMTPQQTDKIFEAFTQADVTTTRKYGGTGLGLAIVSRFCQLMGGTVAVDSRPQAGSCFTVTLPVEVVDRRSDAAVSVDAA